MRATKLTFPNSEGQQLVARLDFPIDTHPKAFAIFAHCFTCGKSLAAARNISRSLTDSGFAVMRFDFTGIGESEGDFADTNFSSNVDDLVYAARYLEEHYEAPQLLIGHSLGGAAVLLAGSEIETVKAIATIGAPSEPKHVRHLIKHSLPEIQSQGVAEVYIAGRPFTIKNQFLKDLEESNLTPIIRQLKKALLVMHSPQDTTVEIENASKIYTAAFHPKSFVSLDGADHLLTRKEDALYTGQTIAAWASRYIHWEEGSELKTRFQVATRTGNTSFTTDIRAGNHHLTADEPESVGGNNFGPTPYDLLLAALGACTSMTLQMYAKRKKWDLKSVEVHLAHAKKHAMDCENAEEKSSRIDHIERVLELEGNLDEAQRKRLLEIADRCPVHKTLHGKITVETKLAE